MTPPDKVCAWPGGCREEAVTTYQDKARNVWKLCIKHRNEAKRRKA